MKKTILDIRVEDVEKRHFPDKHYEYVIRVHWSDGTVNVVYRRYSRFYALQCKLLDNFAKDGGIYDPKDRILPFLPGKILFGRSHIRKVALNRLEPINDYCQKLIHLPGKISECKEVIQFFDTCEEDLLPADENRDSIALPQGESISDPILLDQYNVIADYDKDGRNETNLKAGWTIDVVEKNETGWWFVRTELGQGWVPSSYLEKIDGTEDDRILQNKRGSKFVVSRSYIPQEPDEIQIDKGCYVEVVERNLDGWWIVRYKGKQGRAPASYLTRTDTLKIRRLMKQDKARGVQIVPNLGAVSTFQNLRDKDGSGRSSAASNTRVNNSPDRVIHGANTPGLNKEVPGRNNKDTRVKNSPERVNNVGASSGWNKNSGWNKQPFIANKGNGAKSSVFDGTDDKTGAQSIIQHSSGQNNNARFNSNISSGAKEKIHHGFNAPGNQHVNVANQNASETSKVSASFGVKNLIERQKQNLRSNNNSNLPSANRATEQKQQPQQWKQNKLFPQQQLNQHSPGKSTAILPPGRANSTIAMKMDLKKNTQQQQAPDKAASPDSDDSDAEYENVDRPFEPPQKLTATGYQSDVTSGSESSLDSLSIGSSENSDASPWRHNKLPPRKETLTRGMAPPRATASVYVVVSDFKNTVGDGIDLYQGETLTVIEQTDQGWWLVRGRGGEGWAPDAYIERQEVPTQWEEETSQKVKPPRPRPPPSARKGNQTESMAGQATQNMQQYGRQIGPETQKPNQPVITQYGKPFASEMQAHNETTVMKYGKQSEQDTTRVQEHVKPGGQNNPVVNELSNIFGKLKKVPNTNGQPKQDNITAAIGTHASQAASQSNGSNKLHSSHLNKPIVSRDTKPVVPSNVKPIVPFNKKPQLPRKPPASDQQPGGGNHINPAVVSSQDNKNVSSQSVSNVKKMFER